MEQSSGYSLINPALRAPYTIRALRPMPMFKHIVHLCELNEMFTPLPVYTLRRGIQLRRYHPVNGVQSLRNCQALLESHSSSLFLLCVRILPDYAFRGLYEVLTGRSKCPQPTHLRD